MGPGIIEDSYSDKFDSMACCRGDYNAFFRMSAGWIPSEERYDFNFLVQGGSGTSSATANGTSRSGVASSDIGPMASSSTAAQQSGGDAAAPGTWGGNSSGLLPGLDADSLSLVGNGTTDLVLWPFDRGESRGKLKVVTMRISVDELLVLSYRLVDRSHLGPLIRPEDVIPGFDYKFVQNSPSRQPVYFQVNAILARCEAGRQGLQQRHRHLVGPRGDAAEPGGAIGRVRPAVHRRPR